MINRLATGLFLSCLAGCSTESGTKAESSDWRLTEALYYKSEKVDWNMEAVKGCELCTISTDKIFEPTGPVSQKILKENGEFVAINSTATRAKLVFWQGNTPVKIPLTVEGNMVYLESEGKKLFLKENRNSSFSYQGDKLTIRASKITQATRKAGLSMEQPELSIKYVLLKH